MNKKDKNIEAKIAELKDEIRFLKSAIFVIVFVIGGIIVKVIEFSIG